MLHEIAHTWFNEDLFEERWITEGLADEFAAGRSRGRDRGRCRCLFVFQYA